MAVQWDIGQPRVDVGAQFQAGMEHGRVVRQQTDRTNALRGYAATPNDPSAQNALLAADPALSMQLEDQRFQRDHAHHQAAIDALGEHRDRIIAGASFLTTEGPTGQRVPITDPAVYQQRRQMFQRAGYDVSDVPEQYSPAYVNGIVEVAAHLQAAQHPHEPTAFQQDATAAGVRPGSPEFHQAFTSHYSQPHILMVDGVPNVVGGSAASSAPADPNQPPDHVNPSTGERFHYNPQSNAWEPVTAGGAASGQPGFQR